MSTATLDQSALDELASHDPDAAAVVALARRLGLVTATGQPVTRRPLRGDIAGADDRILSAEHLYWVGELGRLSEIMGSLNAQIELASTAVKAARARARVNARAAVTGTKAPSQATLDDLADVDDAVVSIDRRLVTLKALAAQAAAAKEATSGYVQGLSREITLRGDAKRAGAWG